jgi:azurin
VAPGARVELVFQNNDDMLHNLVIVRPGTADAVAAAALALGLEGAQNGYVPDAEDVLFHTALLEPGETERIFFTAPSAPGEYTYVCTFPGHAVAMRGTMRVVR